MIFSKVCSLNIINCEYFVNSVNLNLQNINLIDDLRVLFKKLTVLYHTQKRNPLIS